MQNYNIFRHVHLYSLVGIITVAAFLSMAVLSFPVLAQDQKDPKVEQDDPEGRMPEKASDKDMSDLSKEAFIFNDSAEGYVGKEWLVIRLTAKQYNSLKLGMTEEQKKQAEERMLEKSNEIHEEAEEKMKADQEKREESADKSEEDKREEQEEIKQEEMEKAQEREEAKREEIEESKEQGNGSKGVAVMLTPRQQAAIKNSLGLEKELFPTTLQVSLNSVFYCKKPGHEGYYIARTKEYFTNFVQGGNESGLVESSEPKECPRWVSLIHPTTNVR